MRYLVLLLAFTSITLAQAEQPAAKSKWAKSIEDYGKQLSAMSPQQYRDKKDFEWIVEDYEKEAGQNYDALKGVAQELLPRHKGDFIFEWRLHRLLAQIAAKQGDKDAQAKALDAAIAAYPSEKSGEPSKLSSLQHLYSERALLMAEKDVAAAEEYVTKAFKADKRFVYFFGHTWEQWYQQHDQAARYQPLLKKVQKIYGEKAASDPEHRGLLQRYAKQLASEVKS
jgi:hypothetical protein